MNPDDVAYYARRELDQRMAELAKRYSDLNSQGMRARIGGDAGTVAVNGFGLVLDIDIAAQSVEHMAEDALGRYVADAVNDATKRAGRAYRNLTSESWSV
jgi:DNA-binding protein YbaB